MPGLACEPPAVGAGGWAGKRGAQQLPHPQLRLGGRRRGFRPQEKEQGDRQSSGWAQMGPDAQMVCTMWKLLGSLLKTRLTRAEFEYYRIKLERRILSKGNGRRERHVALKGLDQC